MKNKLKKNDVIPLKIALLENCELTHLNLDSNCTIKRKDLATILTKDVNNLTENDVKTILAVYAPLQSLVEDQTHNQDQGIIARIRKHFETGSLNDMPQDILEDDTIKKLQRSM